MTTTPTVRVELELGSYRPVIDPDDLEWTPVALTVHAHHRTTLTHDALTVVDRQLERLTLVVTNDHPDALEETPARTELELPSTPEGIEALIAILDHARDYLVSEARA